MKLDYSYQEIEQLFSSEKSISAARISSISFDSRRIINGNHVLFFALEGIFRNGHSFLIEAYEKGVRHFVVSKKGATSDLENAHEIVVKNSLEALEQLAFFHRNQFTIPIVAITGSNGKTTVKEWLSYVLSGAHNVARSPKSYNSRLGVALSLLELNSDSHFGIIEVGIGSKESMKQHREIIQPTHGVFCSFGESHRELYASAQEHLNEKVSLFQEMEEFIYPNVITEQLPKNGKAIDAAEFTFFFTSFPLTDRASLQNISLVIAMAKQLGISDKEIHKRLAELSPLALRLETYDGINDNIIINDTYNLDLDSLKHSLSYQLANCNGKNRIVIIGTGTDSLLNEKKIRSIISKYEPIQLLLNISTNDEQLAKTQNASILIKGSRSSQMKLIARNLKAKNHQTYLEFDLKSIRHNINYFKSKLASNTKLMCMIKASSYGSDAKTMGAFLAQMGVDYLGVAYVNEGIELRRKGIKTPIFVMNCEENSFSECLSNQLEPAIYSLAQLNNFIAALISHSKINYPIHIKLETGMNRLGFLKADILPLIDIIKAQPEVKIQSIYSHLAESDKINSEFTQQQIDILAENAGLIQKEFSYPILRHILNSEGIVNYTRAQFEMVRLGLGMYGVTSNDNLREAITWKSAVSQIKHVEKGDSIGYNRSFKASNEMKIAIIPVGYADGFPRVLGNGKCGIYINNEYCPTVGNVCMDMIMVDVTNVITKEGDIVEIIGVNQSVGDLAARIGTIPYELMTGFSSRLPRIYIN